MLDAHVGDELTQNDNIRQWAMDDGEIDKGNRKRKWKKVQDNERQKNEINKMNNKPTTRISTQKQRQNRHHHKQNPHDATRKAKNKTIETKE